MGFVICAAGGAIALAGAFPAAGTEVVHCILLKNMGADFCQRPFLMSYSVVVADDYMRVFCGAVCKHAAERLRVVFAQRIAE